MEFAINQSNFSKALGPDCFSGLALGQSESLRNNFKAWACQVLNGKRKIPSHLIKERLITLSKSTKSVVELDNTRPIAVISHITKILEKAVLAKIKATGSGLLNSGPY